MSSRSARASLPLAVSITAMSEPSPSQVSPSNERDGERRDAGERRLGGLNLQLGCGQLAGLQPGPERLLVFRILVVDLTDIDFIVTVKMEEAFRFRNENALVAKPKQFSQNEKIVILYALKQVNRLVVKIALGHQHSCGPLFHQQLLKQLSSFYKISIASP